MKTTQLKALLYIIQCVESKELSNVYYNVFIHRYKTWHWWRYAIIGNIDTRYFDDIKY